MVLNLNQQGPITPQQIQKIKWWAKWKPWIYLGTGLLVGSFLVGALLYSGKKESPPVDNRPAQTAPANPSETSELETRVYVVEGLVGEGADEKWVDYADAKAQGADDYQVRIFSGTRRGRERTVGIAGDAAGRLRRLLEDAETNDYRDGNLGRRRHYTPMQIRRIIERLRYQHTTADGDPDSITLDDVTVARDLVESGYGYDRLTGSEEPVFEEPAFD